MYVYSSISTLIAIQSNNFYGCIITCIIIIILKYKYMYNCKYINMNIRYYIITHIRILTIIILI